jgi:hypothetical protein
VKTISEVGNERQLAPEIIFQSHPARTTADSLTPADRRLLLAATFRLFLRRLHYGISIRRDDLLRLADYADGDARAA